MNVYTFHNLFCFLYCVCLFFVVSLLYGSGLAFFIACETMNESHFIFLVEIGKENEGAVSFSVSHLKTKFSFKIATISVE